jgi:nucleoside phosphorylase
MSRRLTYNDYKVGWICALDTELIASGQMLDEHHQTLDRVQGDKNSYLLGRIGKHNVVLACLPSGRYGTTSAALVANRMLASYQSVEFGLMVGIGGGVPSEIKPMRLGDVVVSEPAGQYPGVVAFDWGRLMTDGEFERTGSLNGPPTIVMTALQMLKRKFAFDPRILEKRLSVSQFPEKDDEIPGSVEYNYQGQGNDQLFKAQYRHVRNEVGKDWPTCERCDIAELEDRPARSKLHPRVFYGTIASSDKVMKDAATRDRLGHEIGALCFEMEAAGLMNEFPCLVIRGICDYSDSHKHKNWQGYAATTAAAYAKELLLVMEPVAG